MNTIKKIFAFCFLLVPVLSFGQGDLTATEIIKKADEKFNGEESGISVMTMTIVRPSWERTIEFKGWNKGSE